jgi:serine/threonine protein phosphatase PrpC
LGGDPGIGPMRVWPGGLCVARAIGDGDVGTEVLPEPHIKQMRVPDSGARFALATDGVWDGMPKNKVGKLLNSFTIQECAREVVRHSLMRGGLTDDTSLVLVDVLPPQTVRSVYASVPRISSLHVTVYSSVHPLSSRSDVLGIGCGDI